MENDESKAFEEFTKRLCWLIGFIFLLALILAVFVLCLSKFLDFNKDCLFYIVAGIPLLVIIIAVIICLIRLPYKNIYDFLQFKKEKLEIIKKLEILKDTYPMVIKGVISNSERIADTLKEVLPVITKDIVNAGVGGNMEKLNKAIIVIVDFMAADSGRKKDDLKKAVKLIKKFIAISSSSKVGKLNEVSNSISGFITSNTDNMDDLKKAINSIVDFIATCSCSYVGKLCDKIRSLIDSIAPGNVNEIKEAVNSISCFIATGTCSNVNNLNETIRSIAGSINEISGKNKYSLSDALESMTDCIKHGIGNENKSVTASHVEAKTNVGSGQNESEFQKYEIKIREINNKEKEAT